MKIVYTLEEICIMMNLNRSQAWDYLKETYETGEPFRVLRIGRLFRVPKIAFDKFIARGGKIK